MKTKFHSLLRFQGEVILVFYCRNNSYRPRFKNSTHQGLAQLHLRLRHPHRWHQVRRDRAHRLHLLTCHQHRIHHRSPRPRRRQGLPDHPGCRGGRQGSLKRRSQSRDRDDIWVGLLIFINIYIKKVFLL